MHLFVSLSLLVLLTVVGGVLALAPPPAATLPPGSYSNAHNWPEICQDGKEQSPIDFSLHGHRGHAVRHGMPAPPAFDGTYVDDVSLTPLRFSDGCRVTNKEIGLNILNNGHTLMGTLHPLSPKGSTAACTITNPLDKKVYTFVQMHVHKKAEHLFLGHRLDMEIHLVFQHNEDVNVPNGVAPPAPATMVVGVPLMMVKGAHEGSKMLNLLLEGSGLPNMANTNITRQPKDLAEERNKEKDPSFSFQRLLPQNDESYMAYQGSLTTPPCTEGVHWFVFSHPAVISAAAVNGYSHAMQHAVRGFGNTGNARPAQPINGRTISRFMDPSAARSHADSDDGAISKLSSQVEKEAKKVTEPPQAPPAMTMSQLSPVTIIGVCALLIAVLATYSRLNGATNSPRQGVDSHLTDHGNSAVRTRTNYGTS